MIALMIVEDDPDLQCLVEAIFSMDPRFSAAVLADSAEDAVALARTKEPEIIVLDDRLKGTLRGLDAASEIKEAAPDAKIILFSSHADLRARIDHEPAVDAFLLKTDTAALLPLAQQLTNMLSLI